MTTRHLLLPIVACLALSPAAAPAQTEKAGESRTNMNAPDIGPWTEQATTLPPYPRSDDLLLLESSYFDGSYEYLIDTASLSVGSDGIARYSVVIRKPGGNRQHVIHEGLRCANRTVRIYGMGSGGALQPQRSEWQTITLSGPYVYRRALYESFLCSEEGGALEPEAVVLRLRGDEGAGLLGRHNSYYSGRR